MDRMHERIERLEARAREARTLAEAQALSAEADRLRNTLRHPEPGGWPLPPIFRN